MASDQPRSEDQAILQGIHYLKCRTDSFNAIRDKKKFFEIRKNDRDFRVGDLLVLNEWEPPPGATGARREAEGYLGRTIGGLITYVSTSESIASHSPGAIGEGYVVLSMDWRLAIGEGYVVLSMDWRL